MTRNEQIAQACARERSVSEERAFIRGALWADRTMVERASQWLKENAMEYAYEDYGEACYNIEELIIDFKRAMI